MRIEALAELDPRLSWVLCEGIIGCALRVHRALGPGLLESTYATCLAHELALNGIAFNREVVLPVRYRGEILESGYRIDLLVRNEVIVETKAVDVLSPVHESQLLTYLKLSGMRVGLLINFNVRLLKDGIHRVIR
jgi:GxxExxY protein